MKKMTAIILVLVMLVTTAACSSSASDSILSKTKDQPNASEIYPSAEELPSEAGASQSLSITNSTSPEDAATGDGALNAEYDSKDSMERGAEVIYPDDYAVANSENSFVKTSVEPLSTFSTDVDTAAYSAMRRDIMSYGRAPSNVRIEEMVNYFDYGYPNPRGKSNHPFSITTEVSSAPWNDNHILAMIGIKGEEIKGTEDIRNNVVLLIDVSGSMYSPDKLPLLQKSFSLMVDGFNGKDIVSIVTYAGSDKIVLNSIPGSENKVIRGAIEDLEAGGGTAGSAGLETAYMLAEKNFIEGGNNRIIIATDGDFNIGTSSVSGVLDMIEEKRESGVAISVLGFGMGNDQIMETIADNGNGNYAYIDNINEAKKVLVDEFDSLMYTIAGDVKLQVEFNPAVVKEYRLIGYENRVLANEDFADDTKDAGDIGSGHTVTAFYELVLYDKNENKDDQSSLKYQQKNSGSSTDYMTVSVRYKRPGKTESTLFEHPVIASDFLKTPSSDFQFASSVVEFGLVLNSSQFLYDGNVKNALTRAKLNVKGDPFRDEFVEIVQEYMNNIQ